MIDTKTGYMVRAWLDWFQLLHLRLGGESVDAIPVSLGGTGVRTLAELAASQGMAGSGATATALTQIETDIVLNRPATSTLGDSADTTVTWDAAFADTSYGVTPSFDPEVIHFGELTAVIVDVSTVTLTLTNIAEGELGTVNRARGTAIVTGVHT